MFADIFKQKCDELSRPRARALYVHVPFCAAKCRYCDFYSRTFDEPLARAYVSAAGRELAANAACLAQPLESVFIGGGTPTALGAELLGQLLEAVHPLTDSLTEFTVETNPGALDAALAELLAAKGVNRVSLGVQSLRDDELRRLGRIHTADQARQAAEALRQAGIINISVDLIYGIPGQTPATWRASLGGVLDMAVQHLSCYALSFEPSTEMGADLLAGKVREMDESLQLRCYEAAIAAAGAAGMEHYEISNFARGGFRCRHNVTYWHNRGYLGIGPAAASYLAGVRRTNHPDLEAYLAAIEAGGHPPAKAERLTGRAAMAESLMLGLRLTEGIDRSDFARRFGIDALEAFGRSIGRHADDGFLVVSGSAIRLSAKALFVSDTILADILAEA